MTKPRVISKAAIRRAKRHGLKHIIDPYFKEPVAGVYQHARTDEFYGNYEKEYTILPIGRGGNRRGRIDWATASYEESRDDNLRDFWADAF